MITLKEHNIKPYEELCRMLETQDKVAYVSATGTGKSYVVGKYIEEHGLIKNTIILVPSLPIKRGWKKLLPQVHVCTYQSMLSDKAKVTECELLICDEMHHLGAEEWGNACQNIFAGFDGKIIGTTATPVRFLDNQRNIADEIFEGNQVNGVDLPEAISQGVLPSFEYITALYDLPKRVKKRPNQNPYTESLYAQLDMMSSKYSFQKILSKHLAEEKDIKVAVFVNHISELEGIKEMCQATFPEAHHEIAHSKMKKSLIESAIRNFESSNRMSFLYTVNILNEGIHIDGVDSVVMFRKTQSPIIYLQQLGRALSSNNTEKRIKVFDFVANHCNLDSYIKTGSSVIDWISNGISNPDRQIVISDYVLEELELLEKIKRSLLGIWSSEEDQIIKDHYDYGKGRNKCKELLPHRTKKAISTRAIALDVSKKLHDYPEEFFEDLKRYFPYKNGLKTLKELYPQYSQGAIVVQAKKMGLDFPRWAKRWSPEEIEILKKAKDLPMNQIVELLPGRRADVIQTKKKELGLCRPQKVWSDKDDAIILAHPDMSAVALQKEFFQDFSVLTVRHHRAKLPIETQFRWNWSDEKTKLFKTLYLEGGFKRVKSSNHFCGMTDRQIISKAKDLKVQSYGLYTSKWSESEIEEIKNYIKTEDGNRERLNDLVKTLSKHERRHVLKKITQVRNFMETQNA